MNVIEGIAKLITGKGGDAPAAEFGDDYIPSMTFTKAELALDRLRDQIAVMRLHQIPVPAETQADFDRLTGELAQARAHNLKIEQRHAAKVNAQKARERMKQPT